MLGGARDGGAPVSPVHRGACPARACDLRRVVAGGPQAFGPQAPLPTQFTTVAVRTPEKPVRSGCRRGSRRDPERPTSGLTKRRLPDSSCCWARLCVACGCGVHERRATACADVCDSGTREYQEQYSVMTLQTRLCALGAAGQRLLARRHAPPAQTSHVCRRLRCQPVLNI